MFSFGLNCERIHLNAAVALDGVLGSLAGDSQNRRFKF